MQTFAFCTVFIFATLNYTDSQIITAGANTSRSKSVKSKCDSVNNSALVEHFFNIIFSEFHNTPPGCVCVQMCPDQPTYCYPNGCLKKVDNNEKPEGSLPVTKISENTKPIFFLEEKNDFINDYFLDKNFADENKASVMPGPIKPDNNAAINLRPDPFKDRYKILFKYKKLPKVELKYNLGEQVKNMKSDVIKMDHLDVSKTRWPMNKANPHFSGQRVHSDTQDSSKFFMSMLLDKEVANYPPKYFKRELANNTSDDDDALDIKTIYVVGDSTPENTTYSLENLIDHLIKRSFDTNKTSSLVKRNESIITNKTQNNFTDEVIRENTTMERVTTKHTENTRIMSKNFTNENVDKSKYSKTNPENRTGKFSEMIASLSKKIDMQNNTSLKMMRRMTGIIDFDPPTTDIIESKEKIIKQTITMLSTESTILSTDYDTRTTKKNRQRLSRRLQNSKNN